MAPGAFLRPRRVEGAMGDFEAGTSRRKSRLKSGRGAERREREREIDRRRKHEGGEVVRRTYTCHACVHSSEIRMG
eukprot:5592224-Pyramimonas_sp.AAC.1